jgi:RNA polymerase sigma-70 factor (ECF subfamily)
MSDAELALLSQQGDLQAFNRLAGKWGASLFRFVRRMLGSDADAEDICQEAFLKAYVNIRRLREPEKFRAWLHHIALNLCRDWHRSPRGRERTIAYEEGFAERLPRAETRAPTAPDREMERADLARELSAVLDKLSLEQRTAILLREYQGFTTEEIAEITGVPAATVRTRVFYGLKSIRRTLQQRGVTAESLRGGAETR